MTSCESSTTPPRSSSARAREQRGQDASQAGADLDDRVRQARIAAVKLGHPGVVEPSGFATDWAGSSMTMGDIPADYDSTIGAMHRRMRATTTGPAGDPVRAAEIIVATVKRGNPPAHLLLGVNAVEMALDYSRRQLAQAAEWEKVSRSADFAEPYPAQLPAR